MYSRFKALQNYGEKDLENLRNSKVAVVGLGATGSVIAEHLARHGVNLVLIDRDYLEENDLYSSNIYRKEDYEKALPKAKAAFDHLKELTEVEFHVEHLSKENIEDLLSEVELVMDGTDNFETRILIDSFCKEEGIPWIYTGAIAEKGYTMFLDEKSFSDVFGKVEKATVATCETDGIMREYSSLAATRSALKAVEYLTGNKPDELLDAIHLRKSFEVEENGEEPGIKEQENARTVCGERKFQISIEVSGKAVENFKEACDTYEENSYLVKGRIDDQNITLFRSGRAIVEAEDEGHARQTVSELLGV